MAEKKSQAEQLKEKLFYVKKHATLVMSEQEEKKADKYCEGYKKFLDAGKTEREAAAAAVAMAEKAGFKPFDKKAQYKAGDKIYVLNREKAVILAVIGKSDISNGVNLTAAHIDSPRLDLKQNPLYESDELGYFKTHYYGGIKKYQWVAMPLALHGVSEGESRERLTKLADYLEVTDVLDKFPAQMSGGQKQRIAAARALILDPEIVLADEPTGALDSKNARTLMEKLSGLNADAGTTILMVTHDCNAASYCKRILFIQDGVLFHELRRDVPDETQQEFYGRILAVMAQLGGGSANVL